MNLDKLYKMQEELDNHILENRVKRTGKEIDKELLLEQTILALLVEVGELANATRCFKHWSTKGMMKKDVILEELSDVWHFYLSIGNQIGIAKDGLEYDIRNVTITIIFNIIYTFTTEIVINKARGIDLYSPYIELGAWIKMLWDKLNFTDEQVEQAYMKKHKENYRRQEEGY